jgi:glutathione synthase/RimK-type ligase-like ATP-grasp enzyme
MIKKSWRVAINKNDKVFNHSGNWANSWIDYCQKNGIDYETVDCYQPFIIEKLKQFDCLIWHVGNYVLQDMIAARSILYSAKGMGLKVFPDFSTAWHFDDKLAETYLLQSINAPLPDTHMFFLLDDSIRWLENEAEYPLIGKLRCGSGSNNIKLLKTKSEAVRYTRRMFDSGFRTHPSIFLKAKSQYLSSKSWEIMKGRIKKIPEFLHTLSRAKMFPKEKGYVLFQEFIPNDGYDLKIVVIGDKLSFIGRNVRKGDFRASGGGDLFFDKCLISKNIISSAFETSDKLGFQCMGFDYVVDKLTGEGKIVEISYGFSHIALMQANGYFDRGGNWFPVPLNAPVEVLNGLLA